MFMSDIPVIVLSEIVLLCTLLDLEGICYVPHSLNLKVPNYVIF